MASTQGAFAGGRFLGFFWKRPVQVPSTARSATCIPYVSRSKRRLYRHPKPQRGVKDQTEPQAQARGQAAGQLRTQKRRRGNTEREKAIMQQKMRTNRNTVGLRAFQMRIEPFSRNTVHLAAFSREAAQDRSPGWSEAKAWVRTRAAPTAQCCHMAHRSGQGCRKTTSRFRRWIDPSCTEKNTATWASQRAPRLPRNTPNPRSGTVSGIFQPGNNRKEGNTYYKQIRQTTHSYTTYGNTRGAEKGKIAETL